MARHIGESLKGVCNPMKCVLQQLISRWAAAVDKSSKAKEISSDDYGLIERSLHVTGLICVAIRVSLATREKEMHGVVILKMHRVERIAFARRQVGFTSSCIDGLRRGFGERSFGEHFPALFVIA
jgi:hypothetical protein